MMQLDVYFDYACPFCFRGHNDLVDVLKNYPQIEVVWKPCEAHPRPETFGLHSDLCARGMYYAKENNVDIMVYHRKIYHAIYDQHANIENADVLAGYLDDILDSNDFRKKLMKGFYKNELAENNRLVWQEYGFSAVPSLVSAEKKLCSVENIGISKQMIVDFINSIS